MSALVHAIPIATSRTGRPVILIGGLAVICRINAPYRSTSDVDTVDRRRGSDSSQLDLLIRAGAEESGPVGALIDTPAGPIRVDVIEVKDSDLHQLPEDPTGRLHVLAHEWAEASATPMLLEADNLEAVEVPVAEPGPLVAMKLQSLPDRAKDKEATDLLDISRLMLDRSTGAQARNQLAGAAPQIREDALRHVQLWFERNAATSASRMKSIPEGRETTRDDVLFLGELLTESLGGRS
ncbi:prevent-host-death protein [Mycobacterium heidelbergense]|uniref:Prevent-host-death protein n=2 Tax=Mycobacterium heidelbergense TaxID=53376 RepID=A0A1X0DW60_MYCHE|nr:prevent-host-death protein [Mycobacterium heidelbergense]MCV7050022.1 prevent-host-death protein [Mycobacterium heidelbergense]ORA76575.1 hypothetical protein BST25_00380 [Mycobacterium heidelbergense]